METMTKTRKELKILATAWSLTALVGTVLFSVMAVAGLDSREVAADATAAIVSTAGGSGGTATAGTCGS